MCPEEEMPQIISVPKLTFGTFFTLLNIGKKSNSDGFSQERLLFKLMKTVDGSFNLPAGTTAKKQTSELRNCIIPTCSWLQLGDRNYITQISDLFERDYSKMIVEMSSFLNEFFDLSNDYKINRACKAILDVIYYDKTISNNAIFYVGKTKKPIEKQCLFNETCYRYEEFILGVLVYLLTHDGIDNRHGAPTLQAWAFPNAFSDSITYYYEFGEDSPAKDFEFFPLTQEDRESVQIEYKASEYHVPYNVLQYIEFLRDKYKDVKPIYQDKPRPFYDQFVCSSIKTDKDDKGIVYANPTAKLIKEKVSKFTILVGGGGLGKTMMMHHLLLETAVNFRINGLVPFFVKLKDYNEGNKDLEEFIVDSVNKQFSINKDAFREIMLSGNGLVLLDGLDEINSKHLNAFARSLERITDEFSKSSFIISSRGNDNFESLVRFSVIYLCKLSLDQSIELVEKIEPSDEVKTKFIAELKSGLYYKHIQFTSNPMMLTILLRTFKDYSEITPHLSSFFSRAYSVMASKHDADKDLYHRELKTKLGPDDFKEILMKFCYVIYQDRVVNFTLDQYYTYFNEIKESLSFDDNVNSSDFLKDLEVSFCLVSHDGDKYYFINDTFKEYFVAVQYSLAADKEDYAWLVYDLNDRNKGKDYDSDLMLDMLFDIAKNRVEEYMYLPYLEKLFGAWDEDEEDGPFMAFLNEIYPSIKYSLGSTAGNELETVSPNFVYNAIRKAAGLDTYPFVDYDYIEDFVIERYASGTLDDGEFSGFPFRGTIQEVMEECHLDEEPEAEGWDIEIKIDDVLNNKEEYDWLIEELSSDDSPLYQEFLTVREYYDKLKEKVKNKPTGKRRLIYK